MWPPRIAGLDGLSNRWFCVGSGRRGGCSATFFLSLLGGDGGWIAGVLVAGSFSSIDTSLSVPVSSLCGVSS
jgi:hypothetical protein